MDHKIIISKIKGRISRLNKWQKLLVIFFLLGFLGSAILIWNPSKKMVEIRNSQRRSDVVNILNAVYEYAEDGNTLPSSVTSTPRMICRDGAINCEGMVDLKDVLAKENKILSEVPVDPKSKDPNSTGYQIWKSASGRINVSAPLAENNASILRSK